MVITMTVPYHSLLLRSYRSNSCIPTDQRLLQSTLKQNTGGDIIVQLSYATLGCVWMLLAYAGFMSVVIVFGCPGGSCGGSPSTFRLGCELCGGSTISYASDSVEMVLSILEI